VRVRQASTVNPMDHAAFATLYERYEERAFNLAYRIAGSEADAADAVREAFLEATQKLPRLAGGEASFGHCLFGAIRNACHDLMPRRQRPLPAEAVPAAPGPSQEAIAAASMRLPVRQREALALRELGQLSYGEIAAIMEASGNSVAQLISRARINLSDELRGTVLASVVAPSPECERALPLIATRQDGQIEPGSRDEAWLDVHLAACDRCRLGIEAMQEADASYRSWAPLAAPPGLLAATMAKAAALTGSDWREGIAAEAERSPAESLSAAGSGSAAERRRPPRRRPMLAAGLATLLLGAGLAAIFLPGDPAAPPLDPAADAAPAPKTAAGRAGGEAKGKTTDDGQRDRKKAKPAPGATEASAGETASTPGPVVTQVTTGGGSADLPASPPDRSSAEAGVEPTQRTSTAKPTRKPQPVTTTPAPEPAAAPAVASEEAAPAEEAAPEPPRRREPPGKPADHPSK
jgi:RNA polymerase sigma-70 factor (ECF subfamily)